VEEERERQGRTIDAAEAADPMLAAKTAKAVEGMYSEINKSAAEVNCAAFVAWQYTCSARIIRRMKMRRRLRSNGRCKVVTGEEESIVRFDLRD
jgi:hypothetical protein